ncbi:M10 family metallopeptidase C-terminal domain-containing protein [Shinella curvata]|uniref:M10 family metallopeptidase C-terminal domain-containing protein n=1 Tax=Shinella curvata TaxID=1817964 RepID=A0ABT8X8Q9_9HYPH|nr:M10 family metallopeptidase [Shinella curvata]MCJ8051935.1 M10 family metallopeptidase C-terminal domain-containing protein [Shinella curvata]MDO6120117.1 M10 family metallopeptidase C-terminal domain-containing protein [Shinella curvata]
MAKVVAAPKVASSLLDAITADKVWGEVKLQYYFGNQNSLSLDSEFRSSFNEEFTGKPDAAFAFKSVALTAYNSLSAVTVLKLTQTTNTTKADFVLVSSSAPIDEDLEGFFPFPGTSHRAAGDSWQMGVFNSGAEALTAAAEKGGGQYASWTVLHEIGHSMGLMHTHNEDTGEPLARLGVLDNERYSVMSYNPASAGVKYGHAVTYMALDIAALQALYGKADYAEGASTYRLTYARSASLDLGEGDMTIGRAYACVWDTSGSDTISVSGGDYSIINLFDATLNTSGNTGAMARTLAALKTTDFYDDLSSLVRKQITQAAYNAGGSFSEILREGTSGLKGIGGGLSIANGAVIENARGGAGDDLLIGNEANNRFWGGAGDDTIISSSGNDKMKGGAGADTFVFGRGDGHDIIYDFSGEDVISLVKLSGVTSFSSFKSHAVDTDDGVLLTAGSDTLLLRGVTESSLNKGDFLFA